MNSFTKQVLILLSLLGAAGAVVFWLAWPAYSQTAALKEQVASLTESNGEIMGMGAKIKDLGAKQSEADSKKIAFALPDKRDEAGLLIQLDELTSANGLLLSAISFTPEKQEAATASLPEETMGQEQTSPDAGGAPPEPYKTVGITLALSGSINAFNNFLRAVENNLRIMEIKSVDFSVGDEATASNQSVGEGAGGGADDGAVKFSVEMETYYK